MGQKDLDIILDFLKKPLRILVDVLDCGKFLMKIFKVFFKARIVHGSPCEVGCFELLPGYYAPA
jgi:hypothetical protein